MKNKLFLTATSLMLATSIFFSNLVAYAETTPTFETINDGIYELRLTDEDARYKGFINVAGINIDITPGIDVETFEDSMDKLNKEIEAPSKTTGASSTQVYFDETNKRDQSEHTLKVDVDFAGRVLGYPLNVMFVMDQSGSLNMYSTKAIGTADITYTSPDMNPKHYYKTTIRLTFVDGESSTYDYYFSPQHSGITNAWNTTQNAIKEYHNQLVGQVFEGKEIQNVTVTAINSRNEIYSLGTTKKFEPLHCIFDSTEPAKMIDGENEYDFTIVAAPSMPTGVDFYSPEAFDATKFPNSAGEYDDFDSEVYINNLLNEDKSYDRMMLSKILFKELSNIAVNGNSEDGTSVDDNKIGYARFARVVYGHQGLTADNFEDDSLGTGTVNHVGDAFTSTTGYYQTMYEVGFDKAKEILTEDDTTVGRKAKNLVIFVSDGVPSGTDYGKPDSHLIFREKEIDGFVEETDSIIYFAGIDLPEVAYDNWSKAIATIDSEADSVSGPTDDQYLRANGTTLEELIDVRDNIERIITAASYLEADIDPLFELRVDEEHPIQLDFATTEGTGVSSEISEKKTIEITDFTDFKQVENTEDGDLLYEAELKYTEENGSSTPIGVIQYNGTDKTITWKIEEREVVNARMSFYEKLDETQVKWDEISNGKTQTADVLASSSANFVDENGFNKTLSMGKQGMVKIENNNQLRIENVSNPASATQVPTGSTINYTITVTNEQITAKAAEAENLLVVQEIPVNTTYLSNTNATITNGTTTREFDISSAYDKVKNEIRFEVPELNSGEKLTFDYQAKVTSEWEKTIVSVSQLGIVDRANTLDEQGDPLLYAMDLVHVTPNVPTEGDGNGEDPNVDPNPETDPETDPEEEGATEVPPSVDQGNPHDNLEDGEPLPKTGYLNMLKEASGSAVVIVAIMSLLTLMIVYLILNKKYKK